MIIIFLYGCKGGNDDSPANVPATSNTKPESNAGDGKNAVTGVIVSLSGEKSFDNDQDILTYQWSLISRPEGSVSRLNASTTLETSFMPDIAGLYEAQLIVNDGSLSSEPSTVSIVVSMPNEAPTAIAGNDIQTYVETTVLLDGGESFDPENTDITYSWAVISSPVESNSTINNANTKTPQFFTSIDGDYILQLTVTDSDGVSSQDEIIIIVSKLTLKDVTLLTQELIDNKAKWESQNFEHYQIDQIKNCHCAAEAIIPVTMQVKLLDKSLLYYTPNSKWASPAQIDRAIVVLSDEANSFRTVEEMFVYIEANILNADEVSVTYHSKFGYPNEVLINHTTGSSGHVRTSMANFINLNDVNCDDFEIKKPNIKLNLIDEFTAESISCDVYVEWQNNIEENIEQVINGDFLPLDDFGVSFSGLIKCDDNLPILLAVDTSVVSLKVSKTGYVTKTEKYAISGEESCGLIPKKIEMKLEPIN